MELQDWQRQSDASADRRLKRLAKDVRDAAHLEQILHSDPHLMGNTLLRDAIRDRIYELVPRLRPPSDPVHLDGPHPNNDAEQDGA